MKLSSQQAMGLAWCISQYGEDVMIQQQGHWLTIDFFTREIVMVVWDVTGAVHETINSGGGVNNEVADDPIFVPGDFTKVTMPNQRLLQLMHSVADERDEYKRRLDAVSEAQEESARQRRRR